MPPAPQRSPLTVFLLKYPLFILIGLGIAGVVAWRWVNLGPIAETTLPASTERNRPTISAALRPILEAFFTRATSQTHDKAREAILAYRKSFPGTTDPDYLDPAEAITCGVQTECQLKRDKLKAKLDPVEAALAKQFLPLEKGTPSYHASLTEALVLDRRFPLRDINRKLAEYAGAFDREQRVQEILVNYFKALDEAAAFKEPRSSNSPYRQILSQYYEKYMYAVPHSLKPFVFRDSCQPSADSAVEFAACQAAVAEYEAFLRQAGVEYRAWLEAHKNATPADHQAREAAYLTKKAAAVKKLLNERAAPERFIESKALHFLG